MSFVLYVCVCVYAINKEKMSTIRVESRDQAAAFSVGDRVADTEGYVGTIRYLGTVVTSKNPDAIFAGVEWDDKENRGKHDGSVKNEETGDIHRYFECEPGAGSLVKLAKLSKEKEIRQALQEKYRDEEQGGGTVTAESGEEVDIIFVGHDKIRYGEFNLETDEKSIVQL